MTKLTWWVRVRTAMLLVMIGGVPLATTVSCDPYYGTVDIFRYDDSFDFVDVFVDDCFPFDCFHGDDFFFFD